MGMSDKAPTPLLMLRPAAAKYLGVSQDVLQRMIERGVLEEVRLYPEAYPRVRRADVEALARGEQPSEATP
jgi:excisionase family DNA binding protein